MARTNLKGIKEDDNKGGRGWGCKLVLILYEEQAIGSDVKHPTELGWGIRRQHKSAEIPDKGSDNKIRGDTKLHSNFKDELEQVEFCAHTDGYRQTL